MPIKSEIATLSAYMEKTEASCREEIDHYGASNARIDRLWKVEAQGGRKPPLLKLQTTRRPDLGGA
jgi:hypothetical protein